MAPVSPATQVTNLQHRLKGKNDSAQSAVNHYFQPGKKKPVPAKDTMSPTSKSGPRLAAIDSSAPPDALKFIPSLDRGSCKVVNYIPVYPDSGDLPIAKTPPPAPVIKPLPPRPPFLQVHGNVLYNLNYYSHIDTPYNEQNVYQHTIQTWLDVLIKGQYPFRIFLTNHFSNSSLFRNYSDFNLSYNNYGFNQQIRDQLRRLFLQALPGQKFLDSLERVANRDLQKLKGLDQWEKNPGAIQKMVEARELSMRKKNSDSASGNNGPLTETNVLDSIYLKKKHEADSIRAEVARIQQLLQTLHRGSQTDAAKGLSTIQQLDNPATLQKELPKLGLTDSSLPKGYKTLMAIKSLSIGRTVVNYSELSAKNISVNGFQAEYNPENYYAVATGTVDYRFRDFIVQQPGQPRQYLNIVRMGKGLKNGNNVILTYFMGKRQLFNSATTDSGTQVPSSSLMGFTLEGNYHLTKNIIFTGEVGKSSSPSYSQDSTKGTVHSGLFSFGDHSNEAWATKLNAFFPAIQTRVKASYKHLAVNYQSFSIFTDGSSQSAWGVNVDQLLFKKQLDLQLGANTNDFSNPFIGQQYRSTTVFKSIQATFRRNKWPTVSFGYFPSSQITKLGNSQYIENLFYTLVGNITDSYRWHQLLMNTTVVYTQFYNRASDSGFTYFNTRNLMLNQSVFLGRLTLQLNASGAINQDYRLYTIEGKAQQSINKWLALGAGVKYNWQTVYNIEQIGYSADATLRLNKLGQIQFSADKGFIPGMNKQLVPDNVGRLTYLKTF
jgi:hypothetical protein